MVLLGKKMDASTTESKEIFVLLADNSFFLTWSSVSVLCFILTLHASNISIYMCKNSYFIILKSWGMLTFALYMRSVEIHRIT